MNRWPSFFIVFASAILMQLHAIQFWMGHVGTAGVAWSLILEAVALWLWWQRRRTLAVVASALLISGPFYQLSAPTLEALRSSEASATMLSLEQAEVAQLETSLARYQANSAERVGWAERIDNAQAALDAARGRVRTLVVAQAADAGWSAFGVVALQALALLVVMVTQVLAVGHLRSAGDGAPPALPSIDTDIGSPEPEIAPIASPKESMPAGKEISCPKHTTGAGPCYCKGSRYRAKPSATEPSSDTDALAKLLATEIVADLKLRNESQKQGADRLGVRPADISMIRNHANRRNDGKETVSTAVLQRLATHYNIDGHGCTKSTDAGLLMSAEEGSRNA